MSKYTLYTIIAVLQMFLCTACYEDKGNYDYKDLYTTINTILMCS